MNLNKYISSEVIYFDLPEKLVEGFKQPLKNPLLEKGEFFPLYFDSNPKTLKLINLLVKENKPSIVVETGFGNGASANAFLSAFKEYGLVNSKLYSFEIDPIVISSKLMSDPQLHFLLIDDSPQSFTKKINEIGNIDMFYHDSNHSYQHQMFEYKNAWELLNPGGILSTDDAHLTEAFIDFAQKVGRSPFMLCDHGKYIGVIRK